MKVDSPSRLYGGTFRLTSQKISYYETAAVSCVQTWYYFNRYSKVPETFCFAARFIFMVVQDVWYIKALVRPRFLLLIFRVDRYQYFRLAASGSLIACIKCSSLTLVFASHNFPRFRR